MLYKNLWLVTTKAIYTIERTLDSFVTKLREVLKLFELDHFDMRVMRWHFRIWILEMPGIEIHVQVELS